MKREKRRKTRSDGCQQRGLQPCPPPQSPSPLCRQLASSSAWGTSGSQARAAPSTQATLSLSAQWLQREKALHPGLGWESPSPGPVQLPLSPAQRFQPESWEPPLPPPFPSACTTGHHAWPVLRSQELNTPLPPPLPPGSSLTSSPTWSIRTTSQSLSLQQSHAPVQTEAPSSPSPAAPGHALFASKAACCSHAQWAPARP